MNRNHLDKMTSAVLIDGNAHSIFQIPIPEDVLTCGPF